MVCCYNSVTNLDKNVMNFITKDVSHFALHIVYKEKYVK